MAQGFCGVMVYIVFQKIVVQSLRGDQLVYYDGTENDGTENDMTYLVQVVWVSPTLDRCRDKLYPPYDELQHPYDELHHPYNELHPPYNECLPSSPTLPTAS